MAYLGVSGTFIDEMTHDIPSQNWGVGEWVREFDTFVEAGIDTVVVIRSGYRERLACPSEVIARYRPTLPVYVDLVELFLGLAAERGVRLFLGLYDSGYHWQRNDWTREVEINEEYIEEMNGRYGRSAGFGGWYLPHETSDSGLRIMDINTALARRIRSVSELPILVSPYFLGRQDMARDVGGEPRSAAEQARVWGEIFERYAGLVDYCAFQDGTADLLALEELTAATAAEARRFGITLWSNLESFDRDMPIKFPPIDWRKLAYKLDVVQPYVQKVITFEFSHFMSPNSMWPSARALYERYREHVGLRWAEERADGARRG